MDKFSRLFCRAKAQHSKAPRVWRTELVELLLRAALVRGVGAE